MARVFGVLSGAIFILLGAGRVIYAAIGAWSNFEFLRDKIERYQTAELAVRLLSQWWAQIGLILFGLLCIAAAVSWPRRVVAAGIIGPAPRSFIEQVRARQREVFDPPGAELRRLLPLLAAELRVNREHWSNRPERTYLDAVREHIRVHRLEQQELELFSVLQALAAAYGRVEGHRESPGPSRLMLRISRPGYVREVDAALAIIDAKVGL
jgi:type VI protein secretion system component VasK